MGIKGSAGTLTIGPLTRDEVDEAAQLLARSFVDEPLHAHLLGNLPRDRRERVLVPFFRTSLRVFLPVGGIHAARLDGRLVGVSIRTPPGAHSPFGWRSIAARARLFASFARVVLNAPRYRAVRTIGRALDGLVPAEPHWHLGWAGTEPTHEGQGIQGRLTDVALGLCDEQGVGCLFRTFTPVVKSFCERRGFSVLREIRPLPDGPPCWLMWRKPRVRADGTVAIDSLRREEVDEAAALLARCFAEEALHAHLLRNLSLDRRERALVPFFRTSLRVFMPGGGIHVARVDGAIVGVSIRTPPGIYGSRGLRGLVARLRLFGAFLRIALQAPHYWQSRAMSRESDRFTPSEPHWYFEWTGVDPAFRGRGAVRRLREPILALADAEGVASCFGTFTPMMKTMGVRDGFTVVHEFHPPGGPPGWLLWREPRRPES